MPDRSHDARHRVAHNVATKPRRLMAGLALPTAAAVTLMFTATGAALATKTDSAPVSQNTTAVTTAQPAPLDLAAVRARQAKVIEHAQAVARADAAAKAARSAAGVARSTARKNLAARTLATQRAQALATQRAYRAQAAQAAQVQQARAQRAQAAQAQQARAQRARAAQAQQAQQARTQQANRAAQAHGWRLPITNPVKTSSFGYRWGRLHAGNDYAVPVGTNLASMSAGTVSFAGQESGYGTIVRIRYWDGTISYYGHMSSISVNTGQRVAAGQIIGQSGNSGASTGPHLHLEIHPNGGAAVDPSPWMASHNVAT